MAPRLAFPVAGCHCGSRGGSRCDRAAVAIVPVPSQRVSFGGPGGGGCGLVGVGLVCDVGIRIVVGAGSPAGLGRYCGKCASGTEGTGEMFCDSVDGGAGICACGPPWGLGGYKHSRWNV